MPTHRNLQKQNRMETSFYGPLPPHWLYMGNRMNARWGKSATSTHEKKKPIWNTQRDIERERKNKTQKKM